MVVKLLSVWTVLPSEETVEEMVVKLLSVWTVLPSEETVEEMVVKLLCLDGAPLRRDC